MTLDLAARTHVGLKRSTNQDAVLAETQIGGLACLAVADGMGGHAQGEEASRRAIAALRDGLAARIAAGGSGPTVDWCAEIEADAHSSVSGITEGAEVSGTTLTFALIGERICLIGHVGDSRAYRIAHGKLVRLTEDHTWEAYAARNGVENPHGKALRQAVGVPGEFSPDVLQTDLGEGDGLLLCSDGLYKMVGDEQIEGALALSRNAEDACDRLVRLALAGGGRDNISVCVGFAGARAQPARPKLDRLLWTAVAAALVIVSLLIWTLARKSG